MLVLDTSIASEAIYLYGSLINKIDVWIGNNQKAIGQNQAFQWVNSQPNFYEEGIRVVYSSQSTKSTH